ncbi:MAG: hypothetical protein Q9204_005210, partial [Flavoplaca sp. TL-2023a]
MDPNAQLAAKLANSQRQTGYNAPPPQQQEQQTGYPPQLQAGQKPGAYPGQSQYQPYPGNNPTPSGQYAPTQQGPQYTPHHQPHFQQGPGQHGQGLGQYSQQPGQYSQQPRQYDQQPGQYDQQPGQYGQQPGQYGQQPGHYGQQSGQYGQPPGYPPPQADPQQVDVYKQLLQATIQQKSLQNMYPPNHPALDRYAQRAAGSQIKQLCDRYDIDFEIGRDLVKLALFDIIIYI